MPVAHDTPIALTIAGSDPSGGAGIQADIKTFAAFRVHDASAITAITVQNTAGVRAMHAVPPAQVTAQIEAVFADLDIRAVKIGMLASRANVEAVAEALAGRAEAVPIVLDPVLVSSSGAPLLEPDGIEALRTRLLPLARVVTPNIAEAACLLARPEARDLAEAEDQAVALAACGPGAVLLTGGHLATGRSTDILAEPPSPAAPARAQRLEGARIATPNTHGTGCVLSAAIAAGLARGLALGAAARQAKTFLEAALKAGARRRIGRGTGPLDTLFALPAEGFGHAAGRSDARSERGGETL